MEVKQFYDTTIAHASYAILSKGKMALVDPSRDPKPYYDFAAEKNAEIVAVLETHPHADFVSAHLQIHREKGAEVLINELVGVSYPHKAFNHGDEYTLGNVTIQALHTPGHSPDSNSYLVTDANGKQLALFTGDFLFIGDVGRPDLREGAGNIQEARADLASKMYKSIKNVLSQIADDVEIYPAHGAGSLCGKNLSDKLSDTLGNQRITNWALQNMSEQEFVDYLLADQPFIPKYFPFDVEVNRKGAGNLDESVKAVKKLSNVMDVKEGILIVDIRKEEDFKKGHLKGSLNIQCGPKDKYETWLGSIVAPGEAFYLIAATEDELESALVRTAKIGYEKQVAGKLVAGNFGTRDIAKPDADAFAESLDDYFILDIRQPHEHEHDRIFDKSVNIPLSVLREKAKNIKTDKPVMVHCAGGYRSAAGASLLQTVRPDLKVYDLSTAISQFKNKVVLK